MIFLYFVSKEPDFLAISYAGLEQQFTFSESLLKFFFVSVCLFVCLSHLTLTYKSFKHRQKIHQIISLGTLLIVSSEKTFVYISLVF